MNEEQKLKRFMEEHNISGEHLRFGQSLHSVQELLRATGLPLELITKTIIFTCNEKTIAAMIPALFRVSASRLDEAVSCSVEVAMPKEAYDRTGYPVGGMPCFGFPALLVIDPKVLEKEYVYTGGGSDRSIVKIPTSDILKFNPKIAKIVGKKSN